MAIGDVLLYIAALNIDPNMPILIMGTPKRDYDVGMNHRNLRELEGVSPTKRGRRNPEGYVWIAPGLSGCPSSTLLPLLFWGLLIKPEQYEKVYSYYFWVTGEPNYGWVLIRNAKS